jgi:hypothetical protein
MDRERGSWLAPLSVGLLIPLAVAFVLAVLNVIYFNVMASAPTTPPIVMHTGSLDLLANATTWSPVSNNSSTTTLTGKPAHLYFYGIDPTPGSTRNPVNKSLTGLSKNWKITVFFVNPRDHAHPTPRLLICTSQNCDTSNDLATDTVYVMGYNDPTSANGALRNEDLDRPGQRIRYDVNTSLLPAPESQPSVTQPYSYSEPMSNHIDSLNVVSGSRNVTYHCVDSACELEIRIHRLFRIEF